MTWLRRVKDNEHVLLVIGILLWAAIAGYLWHQKHQVDAEKSRVYDIAVFYEAKVTDATVRPGDVLHYSIRMWKKMDIYSHTVRRLVRDDGLQVDITPDITGTNPPSSGPVISHRALIVPRDTAPGHYRIWSIFLYEPSRLQPLKKYELWSDRFEVVK